MTTTELKIRLAEGYQFLQKCCYKGYFICLAIITDDGPCFIDCQNSDDCDYRIAVLLECPFYLKCKNSEMAEDAIKQARRWVKDDRATIFTAWRKDEEAYFKKAYPKTDWTTLCVLFKRDRRALTNKAKKMGLRRNKNLREKL